MNSFFNTETALNKLPLTGGGMAWVYLIIVLVYAYQATVPSLNSDNVIQIQSVSRDALTFLAQGRWGYYMVFEWLQDNNPGGLFYSAVGCALLMLSSWFAVRMIGFRRAAAIYAFLIVSCISIYYGMVFDFSSTRLAYPLANVCALGGLYAWLNGRYVMGLLIMALAPALYPAAAQVAGMALICASQSGVMRGGPLHVVLKRFMFGVGGLLASLLLYYLVTNASYRLFDIELGGRMAMSPLAVLHNLDIIRALFKQHSVPFLSLSTDSSYITLRWVLPLGGIFLLFAITCLAICIRQRSWMRAGAVLGLTLLSLIAPFALAFAGSNTPFPPRSLIALALLHGFWVSFSIDYYCEISHQSLAGRLGLAAITVLSSAFLFDSAAQINKFAYDKHLASQADMLATNRIIQRIETKAAKLNHTLTYPQPLTVIYDTPLPASPRGDVGTARHAPWSREWIFRLADPRFLPASPEQQRQARQVAQGRSGWPADESVFFYGGTAVVIINQTD